MSIERIESSKIASEIPLTMYEVSGQDPISEKSRARYLKDKEQDEAILSQAEHSPYVDIKDLGDAALLEGLTAEQSKLRAQISALISEYLIDPNIEVQLTAAYMIPLAPSKEQKNSGHYLQSRLKKVWIIPIRKRRKLLG